MESLARGGDKVGGQQEVMAFKAMGLTMLKVMQSNEVTGNGEQTLKDGIIGKWEVTKLEDDGKWRPSRQWD